HSRRADGPGAGAVPDAGDVPLRTRPPVATLGPRVGIGTRAACPTTKQPMSDPAYPDLLPITPLARPARATVRPPGSKRLPHRALVLAALASRSRPIRLIGALRSEDTEVMIAALRQLSIDVRADWAGESTLTVFRGDRPLIPATEAELFVA